MLRTIDLDRQVQVFGARIDHRFAIVPLFVYNWRNQLYMWQIWSSTFGLGRKLHFTNDTQSWKHIAHFKSGQKWPKNNHLITFNKVVSNIPNCSLYPQASVQLELVIYWSNHVHLKPGHLRFEELNKHFFSRAQILAAVKTTTD